MKCGQQEGKEGTLTSMHTYMLTRTCAHTEKARLCCWSKTAPVRAVPLGRFYHGRVQRDLTASKTGDDRRERVAIVKEKERERKV